MAETPNTAEPASPAATETLAAHVAGFALAAASQAIFSTREVERLPEVIVGEAMRVMAADAVTLMLPGVDGKLYIAHAFGLSADVQKSTRITVGEGIAGRVAQSQEPLILTGSGQAGNNEAQGFRGHGRAASSIVFPVVGGSTLFGLLTFNRKQADRRLYTKDDLGIASVFAAQVLLALENIRFTRQTLSAEKMAAVGTLAAGVAHELNTPLQFIGDNLDFLKQTFEDIGAMLEDYRGALVKWGGAEAETLLKKLDQKYDYEGTNEQVPKSLAAIEGGLARVSSIVGAIQAFGAPSGAEKAHFDVNQALIDTVEVCRGEFKNVAQVETQLSELPRIKAHASELKQVFLAIFMNAIAAIRPKATESQLGTITISTRSTGSTVEIAFQDTGVGIPEHIRTRLFEPFLSTGNGRGLGLSMARAIVADRHQGRISFESELGRGTLFTVSLPA